MWKRRSIYRVLVRNPEERNYLEDPGVDERIILKWISDKCGGVMDWIDLAESRDRW
jgi:hypothetical protein